MANINVNALLKIALKRDASDLYLKVGSVPMFRLRDELTPARDSSRLTHDDMTGVLDTVLPRRPGAGRRTWTS